MVAKVVVLGVAFGVTFSLTPVVRRLAEVAPADPQVAAFVREIEALRRLRKRFGVAEHPDSFRRVHLEFDAGVGRGRDGDVHLHRIHHLHRHDGLTRKGVPTWDKVDTGDLPREG